MQISPNVITLALVMLWSKSSQDVRQLSLHQWCLKYTSSTINKWEVRAFSQNHAGLGVVSNISGMEYIFDCENFITLYTFQKVRKEERNRLAKRREQRRSKKDKQEKETETWSSIFSPSSRKGQDFHPCHEPPDKQIHHHHHQCIPSGPLCPISHHPENRLSCSSSSVVTTFNLEYKTASFIYKENQIA